MSNHRSSAANPVRSMTGFAATRRDTAAGEISVSLRSVNHRNLDLHFHGGQEFAAFENDMREMLKGSLRRGHVDVRLAWQRKGGAEGSFPLNRTALERYIAALRQISSELGIRYEPDLHALLCLRGVAAESDSEPELPAAVFEQLRTAAEECMRALNAQREREGDQLRAEMLKQADTIASDAGEIRQIRQEALPHFQARLREKLNDLLGSTSGISEARLAEEAALLADRSDIEEELVRLAVHTAELASLLRAGGEVGKRLDFLLQEMNREVNTLLAKSAGAGQPGLRITTAGLAIKASIERIREQALNLE